MPTDAPPESGQPLLSRERTRRRIRWSWLVVLVVVAVVLADFALA